MGSSGAPRPVRWLVLLGVIVVTVLVIGSSEFFPGNTRLYNAIDAGDVERAHRLLDGGADPDSRSRGFGASEELESRFDYPPLAYAIMRSQSDIALLLLEAGADPNARRRNGEWPLTAAAERGLTEVVRALLAAGADPLARNPDGSTALHFGPRLDVQGAPMLKDHLAPEILSILAVASPH